MRSFFRSIQPFDLRSDRGPIATRVLHSAALVIFLCLLCSSAVFGQTPVLTQHYDNARTGQNTTETILTPANVNSVQFGKLFTQTIDGQMTAQPLYVPGVFIPSLNSTTTSCMPQQCTTAFTPSMPTITKERMRRRSGM